MNGYRICASAGDASRADLRGPRWRTPRALSCEPLPLAFAPADPLALLTRGSAIGAQPKNCTARKAIPTERLTSPAALGGQDTLQKRATRTTTGTWSQVAFRLTSGIAVWLLNVSRAEWGGGQNWSVPEYQVTPKSAVAQDANPFHAVHVLLAPPCMEAMEHFEGRLALCLTEGFSQMTGGRTHQAAPTKELLWPEHPSACGSPAPSCPSP